MEVLTTVGLIVVAIVLLFAYLNKKNRDFFESKGIYYTGNGTVRLLKNSIMKKNLIDAIKEQYFEIKATGNRLAGGNDFGQTTIVIMDPEITRSVMVKDFDHFVNRRSFDDTAEDFLKKMLIAVKDEPWKTLRAKLSPTFTTGKIKRMFKLFDRSGEQFVSFIEQRMSNASEMDVTDAYSKYTMDIIAAAACGMNSKAFEQDEPSTFEHMGKKMQFKFKFLDFIKIIFMMTAPKAAKAMGMRFFEKEVEDFFSNTIKSSIKYRRETGARYDDFIQLMMEASAGKLKTEESELDTFEKDAQIKGKDETAATDLLDDNGIVANAVLFILAGFDTTQTLLLYSAYALALNQDCQQRLREEIETVLEEDNGELTYDGLGKMTYLDMVINETLRMYPPAVAIDRMCTMDYKFPGSDFVLKKGEAVLMPVMGMHYDPDYFPDPEKFDPERFAPENKSKINPYVYMPFGQGPRNCIGMRFALTEARTAIVKLVKNFKVEPSSKTPIPMVFENASGLKPKGGMWLSFKKLK